MKIKQVQFVEDLGVDSIYIKELQALFILRSLSSNAILQIIMDYLP